MKIWIFNWLIGLTLVAASTTYAQTLPSKTFAQGQSGAIATGSNEAAAAGIGILKADGNAVDAAVATLLVQSVVESHLYCFGGEVPIIVYDAKRNVVEVIAGLGASPRLATPEWLSLIHI